MKAPVFSFNKIRGLDAYLSPEMKSTGEAIGYDNSLTRALYKALKASGMNVVNYGTVFCTIADKDKEEALPLIRRFYNMGFNIQATAGTARFPSAGKNTWRPAARMAATAAGAEISFFRRIPLCLPWRISGTKENIPLKTAKTAGAADATAKAPRTW